MESVLDVVRLKFILKSRFSQALLNTYISSSTKHGERTWQSQTCSNNRKLFASNQSQTESEKNDTEDEQYINQKEADDDQTKPKKS